MSASAAPAAPSSRPLLLPQNRKLRHLRALSLRNLSFARPRGQTIDDAGINKSPSKLETLRESAQLHHTQSSENLQQLRPQAGRRRRSTNLGGASPITRQKQLEIAVDAKVADVFFTLHCRGEDEPVYISEVAERATNFNFRSFELPESEPHITRLPIVTVKIWTHRQQQTWQLLLEEEIDLRFLTFLGGLQGIHFPPNCLVFHLIDGVYAYDLTGSKIPPPKSGPTSPTSSYNALMKLATLDNSVQDALATQEKLAAQINDLIDRETANDLPAAEDKLKLATRFLAQQQRAVAAASKRRDDLRASIQARRDAIRCGSEKQDEVARDVANARDMLPAAKEALDTTGVGIRGQRRRICEDLARVFPIAPVPSGEPLAFRICGARVPNTAYGPSSLSKASSPAVSEDELSAGLSYVAALAFALEHYLGVPLPYEIRRYGSRSTIRDDISLLSDQQREFPLYLPRGGSSAQYRFDYAWFLLNKNIERLCNSQGLRVVDIRHTLPNLKYLLYVCSAGTDEVPERKKGGVRGLWAGRMHSRGMSFGVDDTSSCAGGSRRGSGDSDALARPGEELRKALSASANGNGNGKAGGHHQHGGSDGPGQIPVFDLPFDEGETKMTLRTKGLREHIGR